MITYLADIIPRIQRYSKRLDDLTMLTNQHWVSISDITETKTVYIFHSNGELDIFENGIGKDSGTWRLLENDSLIINLNNSPTLLLRRGFFDENVIALKLDNTDRYAFFVNENKHFGELNTIDDVINFLEVKYLNGNNRTGGIGSNQRQNINEQEYGFRVVSEKQKFALIWGNYIEYKILYMDRRESEVFKGSNTGKYFYMDLTFGPKYCKSFDDAVYENYMYLKRVDG
jgi:hypothetical protein